MNHDQDRAVLHPTPPTAEGVSEAVLKDAVRLIVAEVDVRKVILFGSAARGEMQIDSDLDLLVIIDHVENRREQTHRIRRALRPLRVPIDVLVFSMQDVAEWGHVVGHVINEALIDGRVLHDAA